MPQEERFPPASCPVQADGWLSPEGVYYPCGFERHGEAAEVIAGRSVWVLELSGWVHISNGSFSLFQPLTQPQLDTLFDMYMLNPGSFLGLSIAQHLNVCD